MSPMQRRAEKIGAQDKRRSDKNKKKREKVVEVKTDF